MQVDNSGTTVVFDAKTTQAIEEGKNRITMLQVEELRLKNLKKELEQQIISLEADIDYKDSRLVIIASLIEVKEKELAELDAKVKRVLFQYDEVDKDCRQREREVQAKETALHEKELEVNAEQAKLSDLIERTSKDSLLAEKAKDIADERIKKIDDFLKSL